jgi:hypothetical protein
MKIFGNRTRLLLDVAIMAGAVVGYVIWRHGSTYGFRPPRFVREARSAVVYGPGVYSPLIEFRTEPEMTELRSFFYRAHTTPPSIPADASTMQDVDFNTGTDSGTGVNVAGDLWWLKDRSQWGHVKSGWQDFIGRKQEGSAQHPVAR